MTNQDKKLEELSRKIAQLMIRTPGISKLVSASSEAQKPRVLNKDDYYKAVKFISYEKWYEMNFHFISSDSQPFNQVANSIYSAMSFFQKKEKINIKKVNLYFRGITND
ncbi:MAG: hypothetical protein NC236_00770 [Mycoplasma sp.]|nr:hypothetical protein [Mycoplasma sp.]